MEFDWVEFIASFILFSIVFWIGFWRGWRTKKAIMEEEENGR